MEETELKGSFAKHPFEKPGQSDSIRRGSPDSLMRYKPTNELYLFKFKWWKDVEDAYQAATEQIRDYFFNTPSYHGEKVSGAYVGLLDWDLSSNKGNVIVKRVC